MTLTDAGAQLLLAVWPAGVGKTPRFEVGLWVERHREVVGNGYRRQKVTGWDAPQAQQDGTWLMHAQPVVWERVGQGGWGDINGWFLASPNQVISWIDWSDPIRSGDGDRIVVRPEVRLGVSDG